MRFKFNEYDVLTNAGTVSADVAGGLLKSNTRHFGSTGPEIRERFREGNQAHQAKPEAGE